MAWGGALMDWMAPLMFACLIGFLLSGFPVAFALVANGLLFALIGIEMGQIKPELLQALPDRVFGIMRNETLLAIPFFTFMGLILERSGMAEDLLDTIGKLFGPVRGGVAFAVIVVGALLAATTGVVAASVISMGLISLPVMMRYGYDNRVATGVIAASGTLAQIIPPSLVLIVLADQLGQSVGDMYAGALRPSLVLTAAYAGFIAILAMVKPAWVPALPPAARQWTATGEPLRGMPAHLRVGMRVIGVLLPPLGLVFLVLGTIFLGLATPTEAGAMGAVGALLIAGVKGRLKRSVLTEALNKTTQLSCFVLFVLIGSTVFGLIFRALDGDQWVEHLLVNLPGGATGFLIVVNLLIFALAFFLDFFELAFIIIPLLAPVAQKLGIDPIWFGVMLGVNMQTSFMHPPFGFALFYLRSVAPQAIRTSDIYWGAVPYVLIQLAMVGILIALPGLVGHAAQQQNDDTPLMLDIPLDPSL
jgi:tripartite ATP-independent transporter DctM subunit